MAVSAVIVVIKIARQGVTYKFTYDTGTSPVEVLYMPSAKMCAGTLKRSTVVSSSQEIPREASRGDCSGVVQGRLPLLEQRVELCLVVVPHSLDPRKRLVAQEGKVLGDLLPPLRGRTLQ